MGDRTSRVLGRTGTALYARRATRLALLDINIIPKRVVQTGTVAGRRPGRLSAVFAPDPGLTGENGGSREGLEYVKLCERKSFE